MSQDASESKFNEAQLLEDFITFDLNCEPDGGPSSDFEKSGTIKLGADPPLEDLFRNTLKSIRELRAKNEQLREVEQACESQEMTIKNSTLNPIDPLHDTLHDLDQAGWVPNEGPELLFLKEGNEALLVQKPLEVHPPLSSSVVEPLQTKLEEEHSKLLEEDYSHKSPCTVSFIDQKSVKSPLLPPDMDFESLFNGGKKIKPTFDPPNHARNAFEDTCEKFQTPELPDLEVNYELTNRDREYQDIRDQYGLEKRSKKEIKTQEFCYDQENEEEPRVLETKLFDNELHNLMVRNTELKVRKKNLISELDELGSEIERIEKKSFKLQLEQASLIQQLGASLSSNLTPYSSNGRSRSPKPISDFRFPPVLNAQILEPKIKIEEEENLPRIPETIHPPDFKYQTFAHFKASEVEPLKVPQKQAHRSEKLLSNLLEEQNQKIEKIEIDKMTRRLIRRTKRSSNSNSNN